MAYIRRKPYTAIGLKRRTPKPLCLCGCGRRVKTWRPNNRWFTIECRPNALCEAPAAEGRKRWAYLKRRNKFIGIYRQLPPKITLEDFLASLEAAHLMGYSAGSSDKGRRAKRPVET